MVSIDREFEPRPGQFSFGSFHPFSLLLFLGEKIILCHVSSDIHLFSNSCIPLARNPAAVGLEGFTP